MRYLGSIYGFEDEEQEEILGKGEFDFLFEDPGVVLRR